jgi:ribosomal protein S18 acetylase RimI-like enzyme
MLTNNGYLIRNYSIEDAEKIGDFDKVLELSYRYNGDFKPENIFCAVNEEGAILGVGHLEPHSTWGLITREDMPSDYIYQLWVDIVLNSEHEPSEGVKDGLMKALLLRASEIKRTYINKKIRLIKHITADNNGDIDFFLTKGFAAYSSILVMKRDLTEDIPDVSNAEGIKVINWKMATEDEIKQYLEADARSNSGVCWSLNLLTWYSFSPEWDTFTAFSGNEVIGSTMTWMITEERSATENIFVVPEWRNKGVARLVITEALKFLRNKGKKMATLAVYGSNKPAIALYKSLGYRMFYTNIELGFDLQYQAFYPV